MISTLEVDLVVKEPAPPRCSGAHRAAVMLCPRPDSGLVLKGEQGTIPSKEKAVDLGERVPSPFSYFRGKDLPKTPALRGVAMPCPLPETCVVLGSEHLLCLGESPGDALLVTGPISGGRKPAPGP